MPVKQDVCFQYLRKAEVNEFVPDGVNLSVAAAEVRTIPLTQARELIEKYEWLGCLAAINWFAFGIFFDEHLAGVVVFGPDYAENTGVWDKYGYTGKMILLSRGATTSWSPKNTASKLIRSAIKQLPPRFEIVTATVDPAAGEIGTIYQACNFDFVGVMRKEKTRKGWRVDGKLIGSRTMRTHVGSLRRADIVAKYPDVEVVIQFSKGRYFLFKGRNAKRLRQAIQHLIEPYPKREYGQA